MFRPPAPSNSQNEWTRESCTPLPSGALWWVKYYRNGRPIRGAVAAGTSVVVTDFEYRRHAVGPLVTYASAMYPLDTAAAVLPAFRGYMDTAPDAGKRVRDTLDSSQHAGISRRAARAQRDRGQWHIRRRWSPRRADPRRHPSVWRLIFDVLQPLPHTSVQRMVDVFFPARALRYYWKGLYLDRLDDAVVSALAAGSRGFFAITSLHLRTPGTGSRCS
jgi:hypothetical protein